MLKCIAPILLLLCFYSTLLNAEGAAAKRIVSLSLCTDDAVLSLVSDERIAGVTYLSADPEYSRYSERAAKLSQHRNIVEQIIRLQPDVILGLDYEVGKTTHLLKRLGYTVAEIKSPTRLVDVPDFILRVGEVIGEPKRAEVLANAFRAELSVTKVHPRKRALIYAPNGYIAGGASFKTDLIQHEGLSNIANELGVKFDGPINVEHLILSAPEVIVAESAQNNNALAFSQLRTPVIAAASEKSKVITMPVSYWICPGLANLLAIQHLKAALP